MRNVASTRELGMQRENVGGKLVAEPNETGFVRTCGVLSLTGALYGDTFKVKR